MRACRCSLCFLFLNISAPGFFFFFGVWSSFPLSFSSTHLGSPWVVEITATYDPWPLVRVYGLPEGVGLLLRLDSITPQCELSGNVKRHPPPWSLLLIRQGQSQGLCVWADLLLCVILFFLSCSPLFHSGFSNPQNTLSIYISLLVNYYC